MSSGALVPSTKLGPYEVISQLGAGGMGEVYLAKDTRLERTVAIKVLPSQVSSNPDLRLRFEREARAISSLNHPNICSLYDVGHQDGIDYLVMEHLQGETLANRLERGPLTVSEVLTYGTQIADALDKAHRQGLIHRDLKSLNVMLTKNGAKLLDFGLAKIQINGVVQGASGLTHSTPLTGEGTIVGTLQYMAPEQLEGKEADTRSDLFSFGIILYEMVTAKRPFSGKSQASLIASIIKEDPRPVTEYQPETPPALVRVIKQCLAKDPDERWQSARDLLHQLKWINEGGSLAGIPAPVAARRRTHLRISWVATAVFGVAAVVLGVLHFGQSKPTPQTVRFSITADPEIRTMNWPMLSPDGTMMAFQATDTSGRTKVWVRRMESLQAEPIPGTENARRPFWSPDSRQLAFLQNGQLMRVSATGGPLQMIAKVPTAADGSWGTKDIILLDGNNTDPIRQVSATGGTVSDAVKAGDSTQPAPAWPSFLPDGNHFLYMQLSSNVGGNDAEENMVMLGSLDGDPPKPLYKASGRAMYDPSGYIISVEGQIMTARKFDAGSEKTVGEPIPIAQVSISSANGKADFSVSSTGALVYQPSFAGGGSELVWLDRTGRLIDTVASGQQFRDLALSPDGTKLAYSAASGGDGTMDVWTLDLNRHVSMRATFDKGNDVYPLWTPDGSAIIYTSQGGGWKLFKKSMSVDGDGQPWMKQEIQGALVATSWSSRDGSLSVLHQTGAGEQTDVGIMYPEATARFEWIAATPYWELFPRYSPDGRFLAYVSDETGTRQLYVRQLDGGHEKTQISTEIAGQPYWRRDGKELYYRSRNGEIKAVAVTCGQTLGVGASTTLFETVLQMDGNTSQRYVVSADGQRFLVNRLVTSGERPSFVVVQNWKTSVSAK